MNFLTCRIQYPNDPTGRTLVHQHFVGCYESGVLVELYSISSIAGKETRVFDTDGRPKQSYYLLIGDECRDCGLRFPSFIDCTKSYRLNITNNMNIEQLDNRFIPAAIVENIKKKIKEMKDNGRHVQYAINSYDFISNNRLCRI